MHFRKILNIFKIARIFSLSKYKIYVLIALLILYNPLFPTLDEDFANAKGFRRT